MGSDIHSIGQVRKNGKWVTVLQHVAGDDRDYDTFGALANVRNGLGFAGVNTGDGLEPLDEPRGLPMDLELAEDEGDGLVRIQAGTPTGENYAWAKDQEWAAKRIAEVLAETTFWLGDHSHSHATLKELVEHAARLKSLETIKRGVVAEDEFLRLKEAKERPRCYSGGVSGRNIDQLTECDYEILKRHGKFDRTRDIYVQMAWTENQLELTYIPAIIESLVKIRDAHDVTDEDVRYVFGFDS